MLDALAIVLCMSSCGQVVEPFLGLGFGVRSVKPLVNMFACGSAPSRLSPVELAVFVRGNGSLVTEQDG